MNEKKYKLCTNLDIKAVEKLKVEALRQRITVSKLLDNILKERYRLDKRN